MLTAIDHLVIAVPDLETAAEDYRSLGFTVVPGGRHPGVGTYNALIAFADSSYIELIGFYEPRADHRWWAPLQRGGGLVDFCLQTDDLTGDAQALRRAGVEMGDPQPRDRTRPDGVEVRWTFALARDAHRGVAPFIIADVTGRDVRVPGERRHANGTVGIRRVTVAVGDVATVRGWYSKVLGTPGEDVQRPDVGGAGVRFAVGPHAFDFVAPIRGRGPLADWLAHRGPSPYAATLATGGRTTGPLDSARTHGARLSFELTC
jgi:catechol 2,3-dioxygenase-like lactoylglutathione lyase family enzyme